MGWDISLFAEVFEDDRWICVNPDAEHDSNLYDGFDVGRNYTMYGILTDFGATDTVPIANHRGLPKDISERLYKTYKDEEEDAFKESWLYWDEVMAFDWDNYVVECETDVPKELAHYFDSNDPITPFKSMTKEEIRSTWSKDLSKCVRVTWKEKYWTAGGFSCIEEHIIPFLKDEPNSLRLVFWFYH